MWTLSTGVWQLIVLVGSTNTTEAEMSSSERSKNWSSSVISALSIHSHSQKHTSLCRGVWCYQFHTPKRECRAIRYVFDQSHSRELIGSICMRNTYKHTNKNGYGASDMKWVAFFSLVPAVNALSCGFLVCPATQCPNGSGLVFRLGTITAVCVCVFGICVIIRNNRFCVLE